MKNKGVVIFLTLFILGISIYYLSFTYFARQIEKQAIDYATTDGSVDDNLKREYLDSVYRVPQPTTFGDFTYENIKEKELSLGLDLQGGMHVVLEVSPKDIILALSSNNRTKAFREALDKADEQQKNSQQAYVDLFYDNFQTLSANKSLNKIFATAANSGIINNKSSDGDVLDFIKQEVDEALDRSVQIISSRIDKFGTTQPQITRIEGTGRIQIEIPGAEDTKRIRKLLQGVAKLEFYHVKEGSKYVDVLKSINTALAKENKIEAKENNEELGLEDKSNDEDDDIKDDTADATDTTDTTTETEKADSLKNDDTLTEKTNEADSTEEEIDLEAIKNKELDSLQKIKDDSIKFVKENPLFQILQVNNQGSMYVKLEDSSRINKIFARPTVQALIPKNLRFAYSSKEITGDDKQGTGIIEMFAIDVPPNGMTLLDGSKITNAKRSYNSIGEPVVSMTMNSKGAKVWKKMTTQAYNEKTRIAIMMDNRVLSAPGVSNGPIEGGSTEISGNFTIQETKDLASMLKAGKLPAPTRIVAESDIGPTLGAISQAMGIRSIIIGLILVLVFMFIYYAKSGFIANVALIFNIIFILGLLANLNTALTLPGIAGIVLTIGMSIDANVLIFERIKEEQRNGVSLLKSIQDGYRNAFSSILDANITTFIIAILLSSFGEGPVKGFATTLMVGIACSFFTAVYITRVIVEWMVRKGNDAKLSFNTGVSKSLFLNQGFDFMGKRKRAYITSAIVILIGLGITFTSGLNLGVDFKGGRSYVIHFPTAIVPETLEKELGTVMENASIEAKTFGSDSKLQVTTTYLVDEESSDADARVQEAVIKGVSNATSLRFEEDDNKEGEDIFTIVSFTKVGSTMADDIVNDSSWAGLYALILIGVYILARFRKLSFSLGAIIALLHDSLIVISAFAILGALGVRYEVDQVFIAAVLTVIGYSINDTVVVFDRIRETITNRGADNLASMINISINNTISRTLVTSMTTLLVVVVLFIFGGPALKGFSFALLVGILVGTYSSIFIASPLVVDFGKDYTKSGK